MDRRSYLEKGRELYDSKKYKEAAELFLLSITQEHSSAAKAWLAHCYEQGLGVEKDLLLAKDLYQISYDYTGYSQRSESLWVWVHERLEQLNEIPFCGSIVRFIDGIGNVKVIRNLNGPNPPQLRYNIDEAVVSTDKGSSIVEMLHFARETISRMNKKWTCDGESRFFDGYTLNTHHFKLTVTRGDNDAYHTRLDGRDCHVTFPRSADLNYIYVQETILKKVRDIIYKRAQIVIPPVLQRVSERINVPYNKCIVAKTLRYASAMYFPSTRDIKFSATCIQLPEKTLEALCIHELTHSFVNGHGKDYYEKLLELGGREMYDLDNNIWKEKMWPYLNI